MFWFKSRPQQRKNAKREVRLEVELLEPRVATGTIWDPWTAIDITGIKPDAGIYVAGQVVEFSIVGTGEDWDKWSSDDNATGGQVQDTVTITWSGASCQILDGGKRALCTLGSPGAPGIFDIGLRADDAGVTPAGDFGSRNDPAVEFHANVAAIWVTITGNFDGPLDKPDNRLNFNDPNWTAPLCLMIAWSSLWAN